MNSQTPVDKIRIDVTKSLLRKALYGALSQMRQADLTRFAAMLALYDEQIEEMSKQLFEKLDRRDQSTFVQWFLIRWAEVSILGQADINAYCANAKKFAREPKTDFKFNGKTLKRVNFTSQGYDFDLVQDEFVCGVHNIFYNQYEHGRVAIESGDVIIDAGAFIGDTASLFNYKASGDCRLHSFELLEDNIELYRFNAENNGIPPKRYTINKLALSDVSGKSRRINHKQHHDATSVNEDTEAYEVVNTISIDDYVEQKSITKLDFIKLDIDGAERDVLKGARNTISTFKPKLALCMHHLWDDPVVLPKLITEICSDYRFYFKWVQLDNGYQAVLLADVHSATEDNEKIPGGKVIDKLTQPVSYIDTELTIDKAQIAISKLNAEFELVSQKNRNLEYRYVSRGVLKKTFIYDWYLKLKGRRV